MLCLIFSCMGMILCVPFLTLFERKVLSYSQNRKGPNKISMFGLLQPVVDGMKLMLKESGKTLSSKKFLYFFSPLSVFVLSLGSMIVISKPNNSWVFKLKFLFFLMLVSCKMFPLFFSGLASKSKYSSLGSFRGAAQVMAYEVKAVVVLLSVFTTLKSFKSLKMGETFNFLVFMLPFLVVMWGFCMVSETNRAPFDFAEGESELVSGYKTEYSGLNFTLLFLAEYSNIMIMSMVSCMLFFKNTLVFSLFFLYMFMALRATFPRFRYDFLMSFSWKVVLPIALMYYFFCLCLGF